MKVITKAVLDIETLEWVSEESFEYSGPIELCCGPSGEEEGTAAKQNTFAGQVSADFSTRYGQQSQAINQINNILQGVQAGKLQMGFNPATAAALNTENINNAAAANANLTRAVNSSAAGRGGDSGLITGQNTAALAGAKASVENQLAAGQQANTIANYQQQVQNTENLLSGYGALAGQENPNSLGSLAQSGLNSTFQDYNTINQQQNQEEADIAGGITGLASNVVLPGIAGGINASPGQSFISGALGNLG